MIKGQARAQQRALRLNWPRILVRAAEIVESYDTSVTLRQLFYRLVAEQILPNTLGDYQRLSLATAKARMEGTFPDLIDKGASIERESGFTSPASALRALCNQYRLARAGAFVQKYGSLMQVEVDAIPPEELRRLFTVAIDQYWDPATAEAVRVTEAAHLATLTRLQQRLRP